MNWHLLSASILVLAGASSAVGQTPDAQVVNPPNSASPAEGAQVDMASDHPLFGVWQNPSGSVHIKTSACGEHVCGTVVYANDKAKADAAKGGTANLIGLDLFQEFAAGKPNEWNGKVMVPDLDRTVRGRIQLIDAKTIKVQGCLFGHVACKDQVWTHVD